MEETFNVIEREAMYWANTLLIMLKLRGNKEINLLESVGKGKLKKMLG